MEAILFGTPHQTRPASPSLVMISTSSHPQSQTLVLKWTIILNFEAHIKHLCKTSFFHLRNMAKLRPMLTFPDAEKLVHAFVSSRLDYCNALLIRIPSKKIKQLQYI